MRRGWYFLFGGAAGLAAGLLIARGDDAPSRANQPSTPVARIAPDRSTPRPQFRAAPRAPVVEPQVEPELPTTSIVIPIPTRLGGGKPVSPAHEEAAARLGLVPTELAALPPAAIPQLDAAHARGMALGDRLGLDSSQRELLAGRFANQLVRIERNVQQSPAGTKYDDVVEMVTHDTLEDLRRNLGDDVARAAEKDLRSLRSLSR